VLLVALGLTGATLGLGAGRPAASLARSVAGRIVCAVDPSNACRRDPELVAAYGAELAAKLRAHAPGIAYERGMRALPVDFRSCRDSGCGDGPPTGSVSRTAAGLPVVAFVHVVDCRAGRAAPFAGRNPAVDCGGSRSGNLYLQYWTYYADSATLRGVPVAGGKGYHGDDWEGYQVRIGPDGDIDARASSHHGFNYEQGRANWGSDAGIGPLKAATEMVGARPGGGWGPETGWLYVSGGSHAGNAKADRTDYVRVTQRRRLALIPLDPFGAGEELAPRFAIFPPWLKEVWINPEAEETD
jgi:hypothetical protein